MSKTIRIAAGIFVTVKGRVVVKAATCGNVAHAEKVIREYADTDGGLGAEQYASFGAWLPSLPSGWFETSVGSA